MQGDHANGGGEARARDSASRLQPHLRARARDIAAGLAIDEAVVDRVRGEIGAGQTAARVAEAISRSPEGIARALSAAPHAPEGGGYRSVEDIVSAAGLDALGASFAVAATHSLFDPTPGPGGMSPLAFARRCAEVAEVSVAVANASGASADAPSVWLAGVLHDIGAAVLIAEANDGDDAEGRPFAGTPLDRHPLVGAWLTEQWGLHPEIVRAIRCHEDPRPPSGAVAGAVWMGARVAEARAGMISGKRLARAGEQFGLPASRLAQIVTGDPGEPQAGIPEEVTPREAQVFELLADGWTPKQIALELGLSVSTIHNHLHRVYQKLGVTSQAQALIAAHERGWVAHRR